MKFLRGLLFFIGVISFWITVFLILPVILYMLIFGISSFTMLDFVGGNFFDQEGVLWQLVQIFYEIPMLTFGSIGALCILFTLDLWFKYIHIWKWIIGSLVIPIGLFILIVIKTEHYEVMTFFQLHSSQDISADFVLSGYDANISDDQNAYYRQNKRFEANSGLLTTGVIIDNNQLIKDFGEIVALPYSYTRYEDPALPLISFNGKDRTNYILSQKDSTLSTLRYKLLRQREESASSLIEMLIANMLQKQLFDQRKMEISTMTPIYKQAILEVLIPYDTMKIYTNTLKKEYHIVKYYGVDMFQKENMNAPKFIFDQEQTMWLAGTFFNRVKESDLDVNSDDLFPPPLKEYWGYNLVGIKMLQALIPRLGNISSRVVTLETQRKDLVSLLQFDLPQ